jgi:hypothetical protein
MPCSEKGMPSSGSQSSAVAESTVQPIPVSHRGLGCSCYFMLPSLRPQKETDKETDH